MSYDLKHVKVSRLAGLALRGFVGLIEDKRSGWTIIPQLLKEAGIEHLRNIDVDHPPTMHPLHIPRQTGNKKNENLSTIIQPVLKIPQPKIEGFGFSTADDYVQAYREGKTTPEEIARTFIQAVKESKSQKPAFHAMLAWNEEDLIRQAQESTQRYQEEKPLGPFDGVPVAIKDEIDQLPYRTTVGTKVLGEHPALEDSTVVTRLRAAGALLVGKTNMHEIGIGVTGFNPHYGTVRNPYNPSHYTGGSSSGSAAVVASGLCPVAIGADGGGSIRIPAAFCGVFGLKPTFGRVSEAGAAPLCWSLAHIGPIASNVKDLAIAYAIIAGPDQKDLWSTYQSPVHLEGYETETLEDLTLGIYEPWFEDAEEVIVNRCRELLKQLERQGATVKEIEIPQLEAARLAHGVTIASEMITAVTNQYQQSPQSFALDTRVNLTLARNFSNQDYVKSQRIRTQTIQNFMHTFQEVDMIITPSTACLPPRIRWSSLPHGESDLTVLTNIMRYATPANLTGFPALSAPAGYVDDLPFGIQAMAKPWHEHQLLRIARVLEKCVQKTKPEIYFPLLET